MKGIQFYSSCNESEGVAFRTKWCVEVGGRNYHIVVDSPSKAFVGDTVTVSFCDESCIRKPTLIPDHTVGLIRSRYFRVSGEPQKTLDTFLEALALEEKGESYANKVEIDETT